MDKYGGENVGESSTTDRNSPFSTITRSHSKICKPKNDRNMKKSPYQPYQDTDIEDDLMREIQRAENAIKQFQTNLPLQNQQHSKNSL